jgi:hypothetical protein
MAAEQPTGNLPMIDGGPGSDPDADLPFDPEAEAAPVLPDLPKEPRLIKQVYQQIFKHPLWPSLPEGTRFAIHDAGYLGLSRCTRQNNAWARKWWRHLYLGAPEP